MDGEFHGIKFVDSHTGGEPTRFIWEGGPELGSAGLNERMIRLRDEFDRFRQFVINEPRGWEAVVGALLCEPVDRTCAAGVIFFNNTGYLGMCGHGTIGVAVTLFHLGRIGLGSHRFETPVGEVEVNLLGPHEVAFTNVPSYRWKARVKLEVEGVGMIIGDIAWGGNWFFIVNQSPVSVEPRNLESLSVLSGKIRQSLVQNGLTGKDGNEIDHIELLSPSPSPEVNSRGFVYCPGGAYDRSPCGTGTSAKIACLAADGKLSPGQIWVQETVIGSRFEGCYRINEEGVIIPEITGKAFICSEGCLIQQASDFFEIGIPPGVK